MPWERSDGWFVKTWLTAYAYAVVKRAAPGPALLSLGSDDGVRVWANGTLVHQHDGPRPLVFDEDRPRSTSRAGDNGVLVETEQRRGPWAFSLRILEPRTVVLPMAEIGPAVLEEESSAATLVVRTRTSRRLPRARRTSRSR